jgi:hypothetical protein
MWDPLVTFLLTFLYLRVPGEDSKEGVIIVCRYVPRPIDHLHFYSTRKECTFLPKLGPHHRYSFLGWFPDYVRSETTDSHLVPLRSKSQAMTQNSLLGETSWATLVPIDKSELSKSIVQIPQIYPQYITDTPNIFLTLSWFRFVRFLSQLYSLLSCAKRKVWSMELSGLQASINDPPHSCKRSIMRHCHGNNEMYGYGMRCIGSAPDVICYEHLTRVDRSKELAKGKCIADVFDQWQGPIDSCAMLLTTNRAHKWLCSWV